MMKNSRLKYEGYAGNKFCFTDDNKMTYRFAKVNKELIETYELYKKKSVGASFLTRYFVDPKANEDIYILCDLTQVE